MQLRAQISLPARYEGDELTEHIQPLRRVTTDAEMENYELPPEVSESDFEGPRTRRKRGRPLGTNKKVHFQEHNGTVKQPRTHRPKIPVIDEEQYHESGDEVPSQSLGGQSASRYRRREEYNPMLRKLSGIFYDQDGNPHHGIGDLLEEQDRAAKAKNHSHFIRFDADREKDKRLSERLLTKEKEYEREYERRYLENLKRPSRVQTRFPFMPQDLTAQLYSSPVDFFAFQDEMATSSEDEQVSKVLKDDEVSSLGCDKLFLD
jgi:hypothetical protein